MSLSGYKNWRKFQEMASMILHSGGFIVPCKLMVMHGLPCKEKEIKAIDMRFEDPGAYPAPFNQLNQGSKFIALLPGTKNYLVYHGPGNTEIVSGQDAQKKGYLPARGQYESEQGYTLVPDDWVVHAELFDTDYEVIKPALADFSGARAKALYGG